MFDRILIANDGSEGAGRALSVAISLAKQHDAELHMICVEELPRFPAIVDEVVEEQIDQDIASRRSSAAPTRRPRPKASAHPTCLPGHAVPTICRLR